MQIGCASTYITVMGQYVGPATLVLFMGYAYFFFQFSHACASFLQTVCILRGTRKYYTFVYLMLLEENILHLMPNHSLKHFKIINPIVTLVT